MRVGASAWVWMIASVLAGGAVVFSSRAICAGTQAVDPMCGPRALLVVCEKLSVKADLAELAALSGADKRGTTLLGLSRAAEQKGLKAAGMKIGVDELAALQVRAIALLWGSHFVVVEKGPRGLEITDPSAPAGDAGKAGGAVPLDTFKTRYSGFALLVGKPDQAFPEARSAGPDVRFDDYSYDLGFVDQGGQLARRVRLRNAGNATLGVWKVDSSCDCITTRLADNMISPGGQAELEVAYDTRGQRGSQIKQVYVHSNDPISPVVVLDIGVTVKPDRVLVSDRSVALGEVRRGAGVERALSVADPGDKSLLVSQAKSDSQYLTALLTPSAGDPPGYTVKLQLRPDTPIGDFRAGVTLYTNHPKEPEIHIPVIAIVKGNVELFPSILFFGYVKKGAATTKSVSIRTEGQTPLAIQSTVSPTDLITLNVTPKQPGREFILTATLKETAPLGSVTGDVIVRTNDPDQPEIRIPVYALVEGN